jgi:peptide/nickel transport system ATP-binding protein
VTDSVHCTRGPFEATDPGVAGTLRGYRASKRGGVVSAGLISTAVLALGCGRVGYKAAAEAQDGAGRDAAIDDAARGDGGGDAAPRDGGGAGDAGPPDAAASLDAASTDAASTDAGETDGAPADAGLPDGSVDAGGPG